MSLQQKKQQIIAELGGIEKTGYNSNQNYTYLKEGDILGALKPLLIKYGLVITPSLDWDHGVAVIKDGDMTTVYTKYLIVDTESGEQEICYWAGQGADRGDKGANKAFTAAGKYFLIKYFMIESDEDADAESIPANPTRPTQAAQQPRIVAAPARAPQTAPPSPAPAPAGDQAFCENPECGKKVGTGVANFSKKNFNGKVFCMDCQKLQG